MCGGQVDLPGTWVQRGVEPGTTITPEPVSTKYKVALYVEAAALDRYRSSSRGPMAEGPTHTQASLSMRVVVCPAKLQQCSPAP